MAKRARQYGEAYLTVEIYQSSLSPGTIAAGTQNVQTINVPTGGTTTPGNYVIVSAPISLDGLIVTCYSTAPDTVSLMLYNATASPIVLATATWTLTVHRLSQI